MSGRATGPTDARTVDPEDADHPAEKEGASLFGVTARGAPWYYEAEANKLIEGHPDDPDTWSERVDVGTEDLRQRVDDLEEGWESLTSEARDLLGLEGSESESESD